MSCDLSVPGEVAAHLTAAPPLGERAWRWTIQTRCSRSWGQDWTLCLVSAPVFCGGQSPVTEGAVELHLSAQLSGVRHLPSVTWPSARNPPGSLHPVELNLHTL